jgi:hypothetical protein
VGNILAVMAWSKCIVVNLAKIPVRLELPFRSTY